MFLFGFASGFAFGIVATFLSLYIGIMYYYYTNLGREDASSSNLFSAPASAAGPTYTRSEVPYDGGSADAL